MVSIEFISRLCQKSGHQEAGGRRIVWATAVLIPFLLVLAPGAQAANFSCSWTDAGDNWTTTADWSNCNGAFPDNGSGNTYDATISTGSPTLTSAISIGNVIVDSGGTWYAHRHRRGGDAVGEFNEFGQCRRRLFWRRRRGEPFGWRHPDQQQLCADRQYRAQRQLDAQRRRGGEYRDHRPLRQWDQPGGAEGLGRGRDSAPPG